MEIRRELEISISNTKKTWNAIDKIKVAERLVKEGFEMQSEELLKKVNELVADIKKANS